MDQIDSYCALAAQVILTAFEDLDKRLVCDGRCKGGAHFCAGAALEFLRSPGTAAVLDALGIDPGQLPRVLPELPPELRYFRQPSIKRLYSPPRPPMTANERREWERERTRRRRARGLDSKGKSLKRTCYNCRQIRRTLAGDLVCAVARTPPGSRAAMVRRAGYKLWKVRLEWEIELCRNEQHDHVLTPVAPG